MRRINLLADCLTKLDRGTEAEKFYLEAFGAAQDALGTKHITTRRTIRRLVDLYRARGDARLAEQWQAKLGDLPPKVAVGK